MVTAGIFYDYKIEFYFDLAPGTKIIAIVGAVTSLVAATIQFKQISKKVLTVDGISMGCLTLD
jgi:NADH:ubiquinone oxidoreductase subunit 5 (subunit L)/multisubunit Na+/H+ antiporter MnhA subunit